MIEGIGMIEIVLIGLAGGAGVGFAFIVYLYRGEKKTLERFMRLKRIADLRCEYYKLYTLGIISEGAWKEAQCCIDEIEKEYVNKD